ncbi:FmdE family protein [Maridesulfovibrio bastinii]|uniref:FmdE family protein n=1 Tax=Maridesulfovibrio bastinii TaxID=47157 RepID=UPI001FDF046D|nr:FmdE family protein [Maridesulfovibrio bastinii]
MRSQHIVSEENSRNNSLLIGPYTYSEFFEAARNFHGSPAPGLILGGFMVSEAIKYLPEGTIFDAISETSWCLPDAVQMLSLCSTGNGWLKVFNLGIYAVTLYDKYSGSGIRVSIDPTALEDWPEIKSWFFKLKPKKEQNTERLHHEIKMAGASICKVEPRQVKPDLLKRREKGSIAICPICGEAYPTDFGAVCRSCQGEGPYTEIESSANSSEFLRPDLKIIPVEQIEGKSALHDMTRIAPGVHKAAEFVKGQNFKIGDICRLQQMGKNRIYVEQGESPGENWVHENDAALKFAELMCGEGLTFSDNVCEGKVNLVADRDGLFVADVDRLIRFNLVDDVMVSSRRNGCLVKKGVKVAGTRAIPLYLSKKLFDRATAVLGNTPLYSIKPLLKKKVGLLITGTEIFTGLIEDKFDPVIRGKIKKFGSEVIKTIFAPDDRDSISSAINELKNAGSELIITTAGLSVDPDDVTRQGLQDSGVTDMEYGAPILPGAMTLLAHTGEVKILGVPACALYFRTTSLDLLLPRVLAGIETSRLDLARMADGGFCMECKVCTYPKCPFGK